MDREEIDRRLGAGAVHQGLALSVAPLPRLDLRRACAPEPGRNVVLVLDQINDPHNLGAILRSAAAFEVRAVVMPERRSAEQGGAVAKAASGALDTVPVVEVVNLARALDELAALGYWRVALDAGAEATLDAVPEIDDLVLVLGAEGTGVRRLVAEHCDFAARLPIAPAMDSLNVSVAAGIALYALARRRGDLSPARLGRAGRKCREIGRTDGNRHMHDRADDLPLMMPPDQTQEVANARSLAIWQSTAAPSPAPA